LFISHTQFTYFFELSSMVKVDFICFWRVAFY